MYDFLRIALSFSNDIARSDEAERDRTGVSGCGCGSSGVFERRFDLTFFCLGCLIFFCLGAFFSTGASSLAADVTLALRFELFVRCGVWKCMVKAHSLYE